MDALEAWINLISVALFSGSVVMRERIRVLLTQGHVRLEDVIRETKTQAQLNVQNRVHLDADAVNVAADEVAETLEALAKSRASS